MSWTVIALMAAIFLVCQVLFVVLAKRKLQQDFSLLAGQALLQNNQHFVDLARTTLEKSQVEARGDLNLKQQAIQEMVQPLMESLEKNQLQVAELERKREQAYGGLRQYLESVTETQGLLRQETGNLSKALQASHVRGKWGELNLRRVVELAGLVEHCDFRSQPTLSGTESRLRPDLIVDLPNGRKIVVDAKAPLDSYLQAVETSDEKERTRLIAEHCRQLDRHISLLASKEYWQHLDGSPEFVVLYIPLESLFGTALRHRPELLERSTQKRIILATPTTLIALLKAVDYGWKQEKLAENAQQVSEMGRELYERLYTLANHLSKLGTCLDRAVEAFNQTTGSFERRVFVQARRFKELGVPAKDDLPEIRWIERRPHTPQAEELPPQQHKAAS